MIFAQFYQKAIWPIGTEEIIEASGDRSVIILDGRERNQTHHAIAAHECKKRGYAGYKLFRGETFTRSVPISEYFPVK